MKRKVNLVELEKFKKSGLGVVDIAKELKVSKGTISKNLKMLGLAQTEDIVLHSASQINVSKINAMDKLKKIANIIETELDKIHTELQTAKKDKGELRELQIKHSAEIRKQLALVLEISQVLYRIEEIDAFKKIVLEEIGKESPELRNRILRRLKERRGERGLHEALKGDVTL